MSVRLRPHHVLCSIGFEGQGYDAPFTANMSHIVDGQFRSTGGEATTVRITSHADSICAPCPKRRGIGCVEDEKITALDYRHARALGLKDGDVLLWGECLDLVVERIKPEDMKTLCQGCSWYPSGICKKALANLLERRSLPKQATQTARQINV